MYFIYKLLDFNSQIQSSEEGEMSSIEGENKKEEKQHKGSSEKRDENSVFNKDKESIQNNSSSGSFIHEFIPHLKNLFRVILYPDDVSNEDDKSEKKSSAEDRKNGSVLKEDKDCGQTKLQKTEVAMNLFKRIYIAFTQGRELRPMDSPFRRLCWAVFSSKDEFISFIEVISESEDTDTDAEEENEEKVSENKGGGDGAVNSKSTTAGPAMDSVADEQYSSSVHKENESAFVNESVDSDLEQHNLCMSDFNRQGYFLWGFIQAEYVDYDLSLTVEYPHVRIFYANQLLVEVGLIHPADQIIYQLKIYQSCSEYISIEINDIRKVRLYKSVIKCVLDTNLLKAEKKD